MKDNCGKEIIVGSIIQSRRFPDGKQFTCISIRKENGEMTFSPGIRGDLNMVLSEEIMGRSLWIVIGHKKIENDYERYT